MQKGMTEIMNESVDVLKCIYKNAKTATETINALMPRLLSEEIKSLLTAQREKYLGIANEAGLLLASYRELPPDIGFMSRLGMWTSMEMNIAKREDKAAEMIINACTAGIIEITKLLNTLHPDAQVRVLAEKLTDTEQKCMYFMQRYL